MARPPASTRSCVTSSATDSVAGCGPRDSHGHRRRGRRRRPGGFDNDGAVGGYALVVATALPQLGVTLTSSYLAEMVGDIAASHLCSVPGGPPMIDQHVLPGHQAGQTHARACLLDHVAELRDTLDAFHTSAVTVTVTIGDSTLADADRAWQAQGEPPAP